MALDLPHCFFFHQFKRIYQLQNNPWASLSRIIGPSSVTWTNEKIYGETMAMEKTSNFSEIPQDFTLACWSESSSCRFGPCRPPQMSRTPSPPRSSSIDFIHIIHWFHGFPHGVPMVFPWCSLGFPLIPMVFPWFFHGFSMISLSPWIFPSGRDVGRRLLGNAIL